MVCQRLKIYPPQRQTRFQFQITEKWILFVGSPCILSSDFQASCYTSWNMSDFLGFQSRILAISCLHLLRQFSKKQPERKKSSSPPNISDFWARRSCSHGAGWCSRAAKNGEAERYRGCYTLHPLERRPCHRNMSPRSCYCYVGVNYRWR